MSKLGEYYDRMAVTAKSPDRSVTLHLTGPGELTVELAEGIARRHTEESLERQLNAVVRVTVAAYQQGMRRAYEQAYPTGSDG
jgi:hypothetical protein